MTELKDEHFQVIDENKAKVYQEQKDMRKELIEFINYCKPFNMQELYSEMKRMKRTNKGGK